VCRSSFFRVQIPVVALTTGLISTFLAARYPIKSGRLDLLPCTLRICGPMCLSPLGNLAIVTLLGLCLVRTPFFPPYFSQFRQPGVGFIGFKFNSGGGTQYGWARVKMSGIPRTRFILHDYAWGDPGDVIETGQTSDSPVEGATPESGSLGFLEHGAVFPSGSLGLLALGKAGLELWRDQRSSSVTGKYLRERRPRLAPATANFFRSSLTKRLSLFNPPGMISP
jgi:hypothetical protein